MRRRMLTACGMQLVLEHLHTPERAPSRFRDLGGENIVHRSSTEFGFCLRRIPLRWFGAEVTDE